ncbi:MAG: prolipoprotein diacylglyceryl transferase [Firmicutes bacterium]|nr:prolipoprotein diacylglyceryl transferase [Bacillota bacterium]
MEIKWYSVLMIIGAVLALILILKESKRFGYSSDFVFNLCFWTIIVGIIGARAYYVLFNLELYSNWIDIFKIWEGGLAIHGGIIAGLLMIIIYCRRYQVSVVRILDFVVVGLILAQAIGRWGNFFNMEAHGPATTLTFLQSLYLPQFIIDGMNIGGIYYHPTFLYESLWNLLGFILLLIIRRIKWTKIGFMTAFYLMWYGIGRFFIESLRTDSLMIGGFKAAQIVSIIMFIIGLLIVMILSRKGRYEDLYDQEVNQTIRF